VRRLNPTLVNTIYSAVLLVMLYDWPYQVYQKLGPLMPLSSNRERFIVRQVDDYARRLQLKIKPTFVIGSVPASAGALSGNAVIVVSPGMLDPTGYSDNDVRFFLAHELGHIARLDAYRFWTRWTDAAADVREIDADRIAVRLTGCGAMREAIAHHRDEFMKGYKQAGDHHPHPDTRYEAACGALSRRSEWRFYSTSASGVIGLNDRPSWSRLGMPSPSATSSLSSRSFSTFALASTSEMLRFFHSRTLMLCSVTSYVLAI
jgi:hypothetical protein